MKKTWLIVVAVVLVIALVGSLIKDKFLNKTALASVSISATPKAQVYLDGVKVGLTPYSNDDVAAGEHTLRLEPESKEGNLLSYEGKINLTPNFKTLVDRDLGTSESASSGEMIWLEKIDSREKSALGVNSIPDRASVVVNGGQNFFTPYQQEDLNPGSYQVLVSSLGYEEKSISVKTIAGYKLIIDVQLAKKIESIQEATSSGVPLINTPTPTPKITAAAEKPSLEKPYVVIKNTPTGWLKVRLAPSKNATEAAKVNPGEKFPYLDEEKDGWLKIEYQKDKSGWVSATYVDLVK